MDRDALERELAALHADSFAWALVCCEHRRADAEDVLHTAYVRVLDGSARYYGRAAFRTWLFGVIRRVAAEQRRRSWWLWRNGAHRIYEVPAAPDPERLERDEDAARLAAALASIPRRQREVLELVFYHEMTIAEAGRVMGVSLGSARTHYERGKRSLKRRLEQR